MRPKPMVEIGERPILWHIMKGYEAHGVDEFVICCGYKSHVIKDYFANYALRAADVTIDLAGTSCSSRPQRRRALERAPDRDRRRDHDRRPAEAGRGARLRRDLLLHLRRLRHRSRHGEAARLPPRRGRARDADRDPPAGPLRRAHAGRPRDQDRAASARSPRATAAGSTAASSCSSPTSSTTSTATRRSGSASRSSSSPRRAGSLPTSTTATGRTWTACATRWCSRSSGRRGSRRGRPGSRPPACRSCGARARRTSFADLGQLAARRTRTCAPEDLAKAGALLPAAPSTSASECFLVQLPESASPEEIFSDYAYFSSYLRELAAARAGLRRDDDRAARARRRRARWSRSPATTATCCSTSSSAACRCSGSSRPRTSPRGGRARDPDARRFLRQRDGQRAASPRASPPTCVARQQRARPRARPERLRRGRDDPAQARTGMATIEFPHLLRLIERHRVRHDLPRALLVLLAARRRAGVRSGTASAVVDVEELPTHGGSLRLYARHARRPNRRARGSPSCWRASGRPGSTGSRRTRAFEQQVRATKRDLLEFLIGVAARGRARSSATARRRRATRCSTTAASAADLVDYVVDRSPHKQGLFLPGHAAPDLLARADRGDASPTTC